MLPSQQDRTRRYRTRQDPFGEFWREEVVPMLQGMPNLRATTLLEELRRHHPGRFPDRLLRSLQRRVAHWRATKGPERGLWVKVKCLNREELVVVGWTAPEGAQMASGHFFCCVLRSRRPPGPCQSRQQSLGRLGRSCNQSLFLRFHSMWLRVPADRDHWLRWKMIIQSSGR
jgi:hypothetical protein